MNSSKKFGFIWWATAGCGSRAFYDFIRNCGVDDLYNHENETYTPPGAFTHNQGIPFELEHFPIICSIRNPYSRLVSAYLDEKRQSGLGEKYQFDWWLENEYFSEKRFGDVSFQDFFIHQWKKLNRRPDYFVRLESAYDDIKKIPNLKNLKDTEYHAQNLFFRNIFKFENEYDDYIGEHQNYQKYYSEWSSNFVYKKIPEYFEPFQYSKNSWK